MTVGSVSVTARTVGVTVREVEHVRGVMARGVGVRLKLPKEVE